MTQLVCCAVFCEPDDVHECLVEHAGEILESWIVEPVPEAVPYLGTVGRVSHLFTGRVALLRKLTTTGVCLLGSFGLIEF